MNDQLIQLAKAAAQARGLDPVLVCAVIEQESNWDQYAIRYEPAFYARYIIPLNLSPTEAQARAFSWGLMQLMGEVAREYGYKGFMPGLCDPATGLDYGCRKLADCFKRANLQARADDFDPADAALLYWNGGGNQQYPVQVKARMAKYAENKGTG